MKIEIVTSTYKDENRLSWIHNIDKQIKVTVYKKNDCLNKEEFYYDENEKTINIPNYGRCDYAFLWHIVKNYDELSDITVFTKVNWSDQKGCNLYLLLDKCKNFDYCDVGEHEEYYVHVPDESKEQEYLRDIHHSNVCRHILTNTGKTFNFPHGIPYINCEMYKKIFKDCPLPKNMILWGHGPVFSVSNRLIKRHSKIIYEDLLNLFYGQITYENPDDQKKMLYEIGKIYHDHFLRFYKILFSHNVDESEFKIEYH